MKKKRYIEKHELIKYDEKLLTRENISEVLKSVENIINNGNKCIVQLNMKTQDKISKFIQRINPKQVFLNDFDIYKIYSFDYVKKLYYSQVKQDTEESMQLVQRVLVESIKDVNLNGIKFELNHDLRFDKKGVDEPNDDLRLVVSNDGSCIMMNKHIPVFFVGKVDGYTVIYLNYQNTTEHFQQNTLDWFMNKFPVWSWNVDVVFSKDRYFLMYKKHDENDLRKYKQYVVEFIKKWLITFKFMKLVRGGKVKIGW